MSSSLPLPSPSPPPPPSSSPTTTPSAARSRAVRGTLGEKQNFVKSILSYSGRAPSYVHVYGQSSELEPTFLECNHTRARTRAPTYALIPMCAHALPGRVYSIFVYFLVARTFTRQSGTHTTPTHNARTHARTDSCTHARTHAYTHARVLFAHMFAETFQDPTASVGPFADPAGRQVGIWPAGR